MPDSRSSRNPILFILFRIFFNSRFYYPVYALMFLDFGLSQEQFAQLNTAWALAIVFLEIPSGALADQFGRKRLIVAAAILMMVEMIVLLLVPAIDPAHFVDDPVGLERAAWLVFAVFVVNRILSGAAEASASGADEALAYESLPEAGRDALWAKLTSRLIFWQSLTFVAVTLVGAAVYDAVFVNRFLSWIGVTANLTGADTLKLPIALTLGMAFGAFFVAVRMKDTEMPEASSPRLTLRQSVRQSFVRTLEAGHWILKTPAALMLLIVGLSFDSIIRLYYTVGSIWLEVIGFRPVQFGLISVAGSITGILAAYLGKRLIERRTPSFNFGVLTVLVMTGILSLAFPMRYGSVLFLPTIWIAMRLLHFFLSNYLNRVTDSKNRATVLSFRGLSMNLTYGLLTMLFAAQIWMIRQQVGDSGSDVDPRSVDHVLFAAAVKWWWLYLLCVVVGMFLYQKFKIRKSWNELLAMGKPNES